MSRHRSLTVEHPGTFIAEELEHRRWQQADLAYVLDMDQAQLNRLINGKTDITPDTANALGDAFNVSAEFFWNLQKMYDLSKGQKADPGVRTRASWLSKFPVREMIKRGWIEESEPTLLDLQMMRFFEKNRVEDIPFVSDAPILGHAPKKGDSYSRTTPTQYAWLHRVRKIALQMDCPPYSREALVQSLPTIRAHMLDKDDFIKIPAILLKCGVRVVLVEHLPGSKIDGVCVWINDQPVIGLSLRLDRPDNFCFVLRHEIEHVLQEDGKEETFSPVDEFDGDFLENSDLPDYEKHANEQAADFCVPQDKLRSLILRKAPYISERDVLTFASAMKIHPGVVVGQIQYRTKKFAWLRKYQTSVSQYLLDWEFRDGWGHTAPTGL